MVDSGIIRVYRQFALCTVGALIVRIGFWFGDPYWNYSRMFPPNPILITKAPIS